MANSVNREQFGIYVAHKKIETLNKSKACKDTKNRTTVTLSDFTESIA